MDSHDSYEDLELIAALIDGRLTGEDRARAVKLLADSDAALELFANTLQHQVPTANATVVPIAPARHAVPQRWRHWERWKVMGPVAAAAAAVLAILPTLVSRGPQAVLATEYATELTRDSHFASGLPAGWDQRQWGVTRGAGSVSEARGTGPARNKLESKLAFRLGVQTVDLQVALQTGDTAVAGRLAGEVIESLNSVTLSEPVAATYAALRSELATDTRTQAIDRATDAERKLREHLGSPSFAFGQWVGAAELASRMHDTSFFKSSHGTGFIQSTDSLSADDSAALRSIDARVKQGLTDNALNDVHEILKGIIGRRGV